MYQSIPLFPSLSLFSSLLSGNATTIYKSVPRKMSPLTGKTTSHGWMRVGEMPPVWTEEELSSRCVSPLFPLSSFLPAPLFRLTCLFSLLQPHSLLSLLFSPLSSLLSPRWCSPGMCAIYFAPPPFSRQLTLSYLLSLFTIRLPVELIDLILDSLAHPSTFAVGESILAASAVRTDVLGDVSPLADLGKYQEGAQIGDPEDEIWEGEVLSREKCLFAEWRGRQQALGRCCQVSKAFMVSLLPSQPSFLVIRPY